MSDREKARARAQGAWDNFLEQMKEGIKDKPFNYRDEFWATLETATQFDLVAD